MPDVDEGMKFVVLFDDGPEVTAEVRQRDLVKLEEADSAFALTQAFTPRTGYLLAYVTLQRMERQNLLPAGVAIPKTFEDFTDVVEVTDAPTPPKRGGARGKASRSTGSAST